MRRLGLVVEYDGTGYSGWQRQPGTPTVQAALEDALAALVGAPSRIVGAGRTDAGVHALGQVAHTTVTSRLNAAQIRSGLNALLPPDVVVRDAFEAADDFHARRDARLRVYRYAVLARPRPSALLRRYAWHVPDPLDVEAMRDAGAALVGRHDFAAFRVSGTPTASTVCWVKVLRVEPRRDLVVVTVAADRFLRQMVRRIVGSLVQVGRGAMPPESLAALAAGPASRPAGPPAPPRGLYLVRVIYPPGRLERRTLEGAPPDRQPGDG
jgi:tRNA pseudouridine38-40 synthase